MSASDTRRRAEIEAKRAKLAELKRAREERSSRIAAGRAAGSGLVSEATTPASRKDIDDLVGSLLGHRGGSSSGVGSPSHASAPLPSDTGGAGSSSPRRPAATGTDSEYAESAVGGSSAPGIRVERGDGEVAGIAKSEPDEPTKEYYTKEVQTAAPVERVYYTKEVQTTSISPPLLPTASASVPPAVPALDSSVDGKREEEDEEEVDKSMRQEEERLEREIEEGLRELSTAELGAIYSAPDFSDFVELSSKIVERALTDSYDFMKDYRADGGDVDDDEEGRQVKRARIFWDEKLCRGRSLTDLDWSTKHPELVVASYSRTESGASDEPDGLVLVWNMHLADRPEFVFHAQTDVLSVLFSPFNPSLIIGGTYSGQILIWDTRARALPVMKTPLSAQGHTHPVYSLQMAGTQNAHNLVSASTDGLVCSWTLDMLAHPQHSLALENKNNNKTFEVAILCMGFPDQETINFCVGTEEGNIYPANRFARAGAPEGLDGKEVYQAHEAPVTSIHFHPLAGPVDFSDLFLSTSMDWTTRLWRVKGGVAGASGRAASTASDKVTNLRPLHTYEEAADYVYDARWHPLHPALFAQVDGAGHLDLFNLNVDAERPIISTAVGTGQPLNKVAWDRREGRRVATGGADGRLYVFDIGALAVPREDEWLALRKTIGVMLVASGQDLSISGAAVNAATAASDGLGISDGARSALRDLDYQNLRTAAAAR